MKKSFLVSIATVVLMVICVITATFAWFYKTEETKANAMGITANLAPNIELKTQMFIDSETTSKQGEGTGAVNFSKETGYFPTMPTAVITKSNYLGSSTWVEGFFSGSAIQFSHTTGQLIYGRIVLTYIDEESDSIAIPVSVETNSEKVKCVVFFGSEVVATNGYYYISSPGSSPLTLSQVESKYVLGSAQKTDGSITVTRASVSVSFVAWFDGKTMQNTSSQNDEGLQGLINFYFGNRN